MNAASISAFTQDDEAADGDPTLAAERLRFLKEVGLLRVPDTAHRLKFELLQRTQIQTKAENDALHIAVAAVHGVDPGNLELQAHREWLDPAARVRRLSRTRVRAAADLHALRTTRRR